MVCVAEGTARGVPEGLALLCRARLSLPTQGLARGREPGAFLSKTISRNVPASPQGLAAHRLCESCVVFQMPQHL